MGVLPDWQIERDIKIEPFADGSDPARGHLLRRHQLRLRRARRPALQGLHQRPLRRGRSQELRPGLVRGHRRRLLPHPAQQLRPGRDGRIPRDPARRDLPSASGKSTYARCGIIVNVTPLEPEWRGRITIEISNTTPLPAKIYAGEGHRPDPLPPRRGGLPDQLRATRRASTRTRRA